jgi:energy-coupling factor transporter transmembrane protein EcfT
MNPKTEDRHSLILLISLLFFLVLSAFVRDDWVSEVFVALSTYAVLIIAILKISEKRSMPWPSLLLTASSLLVTLACAIRPVHILWIVNRMFLSTFFGYVSVALFAF